MGEVAKHVRSLSLGNAFGHLQYTYTGYMYDHAPEYPRKHPPPGQSDRRPSRWDPKDDRRRSVLRRYLEPDFSRPFRARCARG